MTNTPDPIIGAEIRSGRRPLRAAVIQIFGAHDEVMPSVFEMLEGNGVEPTGFVSHKLEQRGNIFSAYTPWADAIRYVDFQAGDFDTAELRDFDLIVFNSYGYRGPGQILAESGLPAIGIVHNADITVDNAANVRPLRSGQVTPATLAPHVTSHLIGERPQLFSKAVTLGSWMWRMPEGSLPGRPVDAPRRIVVPGAVHFGNRDLQMMVDLLPDLVAEHGTDTFRIVIAGSGRDRAALEETVREQGLGTVLEFAPLDPASGMVDSSDYFSTVAGADFLLPLLPERDPTYRTEKISLAISSSVGFEVPAILDRWSAEAYDLPGCDYPLGGLAAGLRSALAMPGDEVTALRAAISERRAREVARATAAMGTALDELGTPPEPVRGRGRPPAPSSVAGALPAPTTAPAALLTSEQVQREDREAFLAFAEALLPSSYSQHLQDLWVLWECGFRRTGYFCEFGALNGRDFSNSYLLERLGWDGVVAEPHPGYAEAIRANRTCTVSTDCVYDRTGATVEFHAVADRPALSTIGGFGEDDQRSGFREQFTAHQVRTVTLADLLAGAEAPTPIDYLSIDTEGSEPLILGGHDFAAQPIRLITVEHNEIHREELHALLTATGYHRKWPDLSGHDDWYVLDGAFPDWSASGLTELIEAGDLVRPSGSGTEQRTALVRSARAADAPSGSAVFGLAPREARDRARVEASDPIAHFRFQQHVYAELSRRSGSPGPRLARRSAALLGDLAERLTLEVLDLASAEVADDGRRVAGRIDELDPGQTLHRVAPAFDRIDLLAVRIGEKRRKGAMHAGDVAAFLTVRGFVLIGAQQTGQQERGWLTFAHQRVARRPVVARLAARALGAGGAARRSAKKTPPPPPASLLRRGVRRLRRVSSRSRRRT